MFENFQQFVGVLMLSGSLIIIFIIYYLLTRNWISKFRNILDAIFGISLPFIGLGLLFLFEDLLHSWVRSGGGYLNDPIGYITAIVVPIIIGIISLIKKRKALGISLILITVLSLIFSILLLGSH